MIRTASSRAALTGSISGVLFSTGMYVAWNQLPSVSFGLAPLFAAAVIATVSSFLAPAPSWLRSGALARWIAPASAVLLPLAVYGIGLLSADFAFISDEPDLLTFIALFAVYLLLTGAPILLAGMDLRVALHDRQGDQLGPWLMGFGTAAAAHQLACAGMDFRAVFAAQSALILASSLWPAVTLKSVSARTSTPGEHAAKEHAAKPQSHGARDAKTQRKHAVGRTQSLLPFKPALIHPAVYGAILFFFTAWLLRAFQRLLEATLPMETLASLIIPGVVMLAGAGFALGSSLRLRRLPVPPALALLALAAVSIGIGEYRFASALYAEIYLAFYASASVSTPLFELALWWALLPALCIGAAGAFVRTREERAGRADLLMLADGMVLAILAFVLFPAFPAGHQLAAAAAFGLTAAGSAVFVLNRRALAPLTGGVLLFAAAAGALALTSEPGGNGTMTAPTRFQSRAASVTAGGRLNFLQSRDYDDPFIATMWNDVTLLTQNSRQVHRALYRLGHLPMLLHPAPKAVAVLGYGSGAALEAVTMHAPARVVCVEQQRALPWFTDSTARREHVQSWARAVEFRVERPAAFAAHTGERFDVVISPEPFATPFKTRDVFTPGHYANVARLLAPGGVFAQWVPVTGVSREGLRSIVASVASAFSDVQLWIAHADVENAMLCIAASNTRFGPERMNRAGFAALLQNGETAFRLRGIGITGWESVFADYCADRPGALAFAGTAAPPSRFATGLQSLDDPSSPDRWRRVFELFALRTRPAAILPAARNDSLRMRAEALFDDRMTVLRASASAATGDDTSATRALYNLFTLHPYNAEASLALSDILLRKAAQFISGGQHAVAMPMLGEVIRLAPLTTAVLRLMMIGAMQGGDARLAGECIDGIKKLNPRHAGFRDNQATLRAQQGNLNDALLLYESAITIDPTNEEFYCNMASAQFQAGRVWEAIRILDRASTESYYPAKAYALKGNFYLDRRKNDLAREAYLGYMRVAMPDDPLRENVQGALLSLKK
ncbi:MAG: tetratricopeptide repeat protein [Ignavibacteria bacterium]|nr:tetratricopeptide repeat protein [Ignavibacteria bacterium]